MDLLLTHGYFLKEDPKEQAIMKPYPPLGILYLSSHLRRQGFDVEIFDSTFADRRNLTAVLESEKPAILGVYSTLMTRRSVLEIIRTALDAGWKIVVGGPEPQAYAEEYLKAGAHVVVMGEGEITLGETISALNSGDFDSLHQVRGIAFQDREGKTIQTDARGMIPDLDAQPWPDRERIAIEDYLKTWREHHGSGSLSIITARGCPYHCRWCSHATYGKTHRRRSVRAVVDEIESLVIRYQPEMLWIADDVFTISAKWVSEYAAEMKRRGLRIPFECITRADRLKPETADELAELGCFRVWIGSESGSQRILDAMQRGVKVEEVRAAISLCRSRGIQTGMFLMWGYEGEELSDMEATVSLAKDALPDHILTTVSYPIKGTPYYDQVADRLMSPAPWEETSDRDVSIRGRHSRRFFQFADRLLRSEVALQKLVAAHTASPNDSAVADLRRESDAARAGMRETYNEVEA